MKSLAFILVIFASNGDLSTFAGGVQADEPRTQAIAARQPQLTPASGLDSLDSAYHSLATSRLLHITRLHDYAATGTFPLNTDFPGQLVPYFVDEMGTACAVGHLMRLDGQEQLVSGIASRSNHIRIENVIDGPLLDWIRDSGLTQDECALIQPSYATIEDYRHGPPWQNEVVRLQEHFAKVERTLLTQSQRSLREALIAKVDAQIVNNPNDPALSIDALSIALESDEPNVRIAAAHAMLRISNASRDAKLSALEPNLSDADPAGRFWTAVAIETIGAASPRGNMELHSRTLPAFLYAFRNGQGDLRLAALNQLACIAPMTIGTNKQFRILPEIRRTMVTACDDENSDIRTFAKSILSSWRWQRTAYESQRIKRHNLAASHELEALAAETLAIGREFAEQPRSVKQLVALRSIYDVANSIAYMLPVATDTPTPIANTEGDAEQVVNDYLVRTFKEYLEGDNPPSWRIESTETDKHGLYFAVTVWRTGMASPKLIYVIPRPSMLSSANMPPHSWFEKGKQSAPYQSPALPAPTLQPKANANIVLGSDARNDLRKFTATCDIFASFMTYYAQIVIDREIQETPDTLIWSGRFACLRQYNPRFFERGGGGSSELGGGGWDFHRLIFSCDRTTGTLTLFAEPIEYPTAQLPPDVLTPAWVTRELELMGWKPLESLDFFGDALFPLEYREAIDAFDPDSASNSRQMLYRRYAIEKSLPYPALILGLLYDRAGQRETAIRLMNEAANSGKHEPGTLADVARWELSVERFAEARQHAEAALSFWPEHPDAKNVVRRLDEIASGRLQE